MGWLGWRVGWWAVCATQVNRISHSAFLDKPVRYVCVVCVCVRMCVCVCVCVCVLAETSRLQQLHLEIIICEKEFEHIRDLRVVGLVDPCAAESTVHTSLVFNEESRSL